MFRITVLAIIIISTHCFTSHAESKPDTSVVRAYLKKAESLYKINADSALFYSRKALSEAPHITNPYFVSEINKTYGFAIYLKANYDSAGFYLKKAIKVVPKIETPFLASLYNDYASVLIMSNNFDSALYYNQKAFTISKKLKIEKELLKSYSNFGFIYKSFGAIDISTRYIFLGLPIAEKLKDTLVIIKLLRSISINYRLMNKPLLCISYEKKNLNYALGIKNFKRASEIANTIANAYDDLEQFSEARRYYLIAYDYARKVNYPTMEAASLVNIGSYYVNKNKMDSAMIYLTAGNKIAQQYNYLNIITAADIAFSKIYKHNKQYHKAVQQLLETIKRGRKIDNIQINEAYQLLSLVYEAMGDYPNAYKYHLIYAQRNDSIFNLHKTEEIANLRMQYELNKKQEQMDAEVKQKEAALQAETKRYKLIRNITIGGFFATLIIAILVVISYRFPPRPKIYNLKNEINSYRQRLMAQQMNPHFIFNMLNSVQYFIYNNKKEESMDFVSQFAKLMRLNLYNSQNDIVSLKDEIEALKLYLELERIRLDNKFDYHIEIDPIIDIETQLVPSFLIQPLVENSIKHGISKIEQKGNIRTKISRNNGSLIYSIVDNGVGFEKSKVGANNTDHISYGLELTKKRILLLGILNNKKTDFIFADIKENGECLGSKVELIFPSSLRFM